MNAEAIQDAVRELDAELGEVRQAVQLEKYGAAYDECKIVGTPEGLAALGRELLRSAVTPEKPTSPPGPSAVKANLSPLFTRSSNIDFKWVERVEALGDEHHHVEPTKAEKTTAVIVVSGALVLLTLAAIGGYALWSWL